jgi:hypothetical protein
VQQPKPALSIAGRTAAFFLRPFFALADFFAVDDFLAFIVLAGLVRFDGLDGFLITHPTLC